MRKHKTKAVLGVLVAVLMVSSGFAAVPMAGNSGNDKKATVSSPTEPTETVDLKADDDGDDKPYVLDQSVREVPDASTSTAGQNANDVNYNTDVGNNIYSAAPLYPGEPNDRAPGRGSEGQLDPGSDSADWYYFSAQAGQTIEGSISSFAMELKDPSGENTLGSGTSFSATAEKTGNYFLRVYTPEGASAGSYELDLALSGQNDAGSGGDAGNSMGSATAISPGSYQGYLDSNDWSDWYSFDASNGQGIKVALTIKAVKSDFDIYLYNPDGEMVTQSTWYSKNPNNPDGDDTLEYPADAGGTWYLKVNVFPGFDESKWPDNYFLYGSGPYAFDLQVGGSAESPPGPISQPDVKPIAQTFKIQSNPASTKDEFAYAAAVPAANYLDGGQRYVSPIVYTGDDSKTWWYGTVDDTTQYLLDDWNTYMERHGKTATEYTVTNDDPVQAAYDIATEHWDSADTAVVVPDGSEMSDTVTKVVDKSGLSLSTTPDQMTLSPDSSKFIDIGGRKAVPQLLGSSVGGIQMKVPSDGFSMDTGILTPRYENVQEDWWPYPYDASGPDSDTWYPVVMPGMYAPYVTGTSGMEELIINKFPGKRYDITVEDAQSSINVTVTTDSPSKTMVYLVDPQGVLRRPNMPDWVGTPEPIYHWNGGHWEHNYDDFRKWRPEAKTTRSVELHNPSEGTWHAVVVQHPTGETGGSVSFDITAKVRSHNKNRCNAQLSAANGAVLASLNHAPLLYVDPSEVPTATDNALSELGDPDIIYVNIGEASAADPGASTTYTSMRQVVNAIKGYEASENYITGTTSGSLKGFFAPSAMIAAYHGSPVFDIGREAPAAINRLDKARATTYQMGDYYHGCLATGHLHKMGHPFDLVDSLKNLITDQSLPPIGFDQHKRWFGGAQEAIYGNITAEYGLDNEGKEAYMFVSYRKQGIRDPITTVMSGNESFAGQIPLRNPALSTAQICRDILYPAIIYANPGRDTCTSQLMNFADGRSWTTNDGESHATYTSRNFKQSFISHGRRYEGHCQWQGLLERYNKGALLSYYCGHGTGGSGISAMWRNMAEQFPPAHTNHKDLKDFTWWDGWRGYMYDDSQTKSPRSGGFTWYNAAGKNLYNIIHFKYADKYFENLHSEIDLWMSCTTATHMGPNIYLQHGAALYYGNGGTGLCPQEELLDADMANSMLVHGKSIGEAFSEEVWLHQRDYTTDDPTAMYGGSSMQVTNVQAIFGDPAMTVYSPEWTEPTPVEP